MSVAYFALFEIVLVTLGLFGLPLPVSVPPLPEDPALLRAAPADSLVFAQWFGAASPRADSGNATERMVAEPELQAFALAVRDALRQGLVREGASPLGVELFDLGLRAVQRPGCAFVSSLGTGATPFAGGLVLSLGDDLQTGAALLRRIEAELLEGGIHEGWDDAPPLPIVADGVSFRPLPMPGADAPRLSWAVVDRYLVLAAGEETPANVVAGLRGGAGLTAHAGFQQVHSQVRVARPSMRSFVDVGRLVELGLAMASPRERAVFERFGLGTLRVLVSESGLEGDGAAQRTMLGLEPKGVAALRVFAGKPLTEADLHVVPGDATCALALRADPLLIYQAVRGLVGEIEPQARADLDRAVEELEASTELSLERDILAPLGDAVTAWSAPSQGGLLVTGATVAIALDDAARFQQTFERLMAVLAQTMPTMAPEGRVRRGVYLGQTEFADRTVWFLNTVGDDMPLAPAWCVTDTHLLLSLFPQTLKSCLARGVDAQDSLAGRVELGGPDGAAGLSVVDMPAAVRTLYPALLMLGQLAAAELQREGVALHVGLLPSVGALTRELGDQLVRLRLDDRGLVFTRQGTLPFADPLLLLGAPSMAWLGYRSAAVSVRMQMERARALELIEAERARQLEAERKRKKEPAPSPQ